MLLPLSYTWRSLVVRRNATLLTILGIGATVAVMSGVLSLRAGFVTLFSEQGRDDVAIFMRPGATNEGSSAFPRDLADRLIKTVPEIAPAPDDAGGQPMGSMECFLAVRREKAGGGGETNVAVRGVQPMSFEVFDQLEVVEGQRFQFGSDELIVGRKLVDRIANCRVGEVLVFNTTPFKVVGIFACEGSFESEIWGDFERLSRALDLSFPNRVVARLQPGADLAALSKRLENDKEIPATVSTERAYLTSMTDGISIMLLSLSVFLSLIMGVAAVFTASNTMLANVAGRAREIGILLAVGFRPFPIFLAFLFEALLLGLAGGLVGCLLTLPIHGIETGTSNFQTFTEVAFAFRVTPGVLLAAVIFSMGLGVVGGTIPAWRAARLKPTEAMRRL